MDQLHNPLLVAIAIAWLGVGCATTPPPDTDSILGDALPSETVIPGEWAEAAEQGRVPDGWLRSFEDARMEAIVGEALRNNLSLRAAVARLDEAAAIAIQAGALMKPVVGLGGDVGASELAGGSGASSSYGASVGISWELDLWGKLRTISQAGEEQFQAAAADFEFARQSLAAQAAKSWYLATESRQQLALAEETVEIRRRLLELVEAKHAQGRITMQDVHLAHADLSSAEDFMRQALGAHEQALRSVEVLLGRYPSAELEVAEEFVPVPAPPPAGLPSDILERRADVVAAERRVRAAFLGAEAARLAKLPSVTLTAAGGGVNNDVLDAIGRGAGFWSTGANFFVPIFDGGALDAQVEIQTAQQEAALASYGQTALVAFAEVETHLSNEKLLEERQQFVAAALDDNEAAYRIARAQFDMGKVDLLSVLQMQARVLGARSGAIRLQSMRIAERIDLHLALGGGFAEIDDVVEPADPSEAQEQ